MVMSEGQWWVPGKGRQKKRRESRKDDGYLLETKIHLSIIYRVQSTLHWGI